MISAMFVQSYRINIAKALWLWLWLRLWLWQGKQDTCPLLKIEGYCFISKQFSNCLLFLVGNKIEKTNCNALHWCCGGGKRAAAAVAGKHSSHLHFHFHSFPLLSPRHNTSSPCITQLLSSSSYDLNSAPGGGGSVGGGGGGIQLWGLYMQTWQFVNIFFVNCYKVAEWW